MRAIRPALALDPRRFGRRSPAAAEAATVHKSAFHDDLRLFATAFAAGFLFVSVLIA